MKKILVLFAHPAYQNSRTNRRLIEALTGAEHIRVHDLYEVYPDFHIDVGREQALLRDHDLIVFQHPLYWYSSPSLLKEWQDLVLEFGFAYGQGGTALQGKRLLSVITTGGGAEAYRPEGINRFQIGELLRPFDQTAHLCGMAYLPPFVVHATHRLASEEQIAPYAKGYRALLEALRDERLTNGQLAGAVYLNDCLEPLGMEPAGSRVA
ncbi:MAG: NAD(P)H-dependent oxidoreductase [bacterium]